MSTLPSPARRAALAAGVGSFALLAAGCSERVTHLAGPGSRVQSFQGWSMGSTYTVKIAGPAVSGAALAAAQSAVAQVLAEVVALMSHYDAGSEVSRLNRQPVGLALAVSAPTLQVLQRAEAVRMASAGAFDVALGRAVDEWGFGASGRAPAVPAADALQRLQGKHGAGALALDARAGTVTRQAEVWANLSGIAKGYGVDRAAAALERLGLGDYMVEVGGEIRARGRNGAGRPWQLAIERPDAMPQQALRIVPLDGQALATSGDYRNFFMHQGRRYSHEIDPASAAPVQHALASVSVVAGDCTLADAWSTALFVLGPERGFALAAQQGLAAHFVLRQGDGTFVERQTAAFAALGGHAAG
jgi:thiamine biosynthesis lipoprotein